MMFIFRALKNKAMYNAEVIKTISITDYLSSRGFERDRKSNRNFTFYKSPLGDEKTASFAINEHKNTWFDYGRGFGGDVIKLVELLEHCTFLEACEKLQNSSLCKVSIIEAKQPSLIIREIKPLVNNNLINYLRFERRLNIDLCREYVNEIHFENNNSRQYAIGFKNDKGGFELRNKFLKIGTSPKWVTTIPGTDTRNIFEGFIDFLSCVTYLRRKPTETIIVLNSVSLLSRIEPITGKVRFWGDNDRAGDECFNKLTGAIDERGLFKPYKDFNEFLTAKK